MKLRALLCVAGIALSAVPARSGSIADQIAKAKADTSKVVKPPAVRLDPTTQVPNSSTPAPAPVIASTGIAQGNPDSTTRAPSDTTAIKQLPPRTLPFKKQMMFAGGFMIFLALMLTSMQNFNPND